MWTISEMAKMTGLTTVALRHYEKIGILSSKRQENGYRYYEEEDLLMIRDVVVLKYAGFSLEDIKELISLYREEESAGCNARGNEVFHRNLKVMRKKVCLLQEIIQTIESIQPLFETHESFKEHRGELDQRIGSIFEQIQGDLEQ